MRAALVNITHQDSEQRVKALSVLGKHGAKKRHAAAVAASLNDDHQIVRRAAVEALGKFGTRKHMGAVARCTGDEAWSVRAAAMRVLGLLCHKSRHNLNPSVEWRQQTEENYACIASGIVLERLRDEANEAVREAARESIELMLQRSHPRFLKPCLTQIPQYLGPCSAQATVQQWQARVVAWVMVCAHLQLPMHPLRDWVADLL